MLLDDFAFGSPFFWLTQLFVFQSESFRNVYNDEWNLFDPLFVTAVICSPLDRPYSAWSPDASTFTSPIDSMFMASIWPLLPVSMAEAPSIMMLFWPTAPRRAAPCKFAPGI